MDVSEAHVHLPHVMLCNCDVGSFPVTCQLVDIE